MQRVRVKAQNGEWQDATMDAEELVDWFTAHTKDGAVTDEIMLFGEAAIEKAADDANGIDWVMSTMDLDRDMERVDPDGADFKNFKKNPVVLWSHDHSIPAIGKVMSPRVKDGAVRGKVIFDSENDEFAGMIAKKVKAGMISAGSIGFKPNNVEFIEESKDPTRLIHRKWELVEFSICNVPSNQSALAQREGKGEEEKAQDYTSELRKEIAILSGRIQAVEMEIQKQVEVRKTYLDRLFEERPETRTVTVNPDSVSIMFDADVPSPATSNGSLAQIFGGKNG